jgi:hypothetical protein
MFPAGWREGCHDPWQFCQLPAASHARLEQPLGTTRAYGARSAHVRLTRETFQTRLHEPYADSDTPCRSASFNPEAIATVFRARLARPSWPPPVYLDRFCIANGLFAPTARLLADLAQITSGRTAFPLAGTSSQRPKPGLFWSSIGWLALATSQRAERPGGQADRVATWGGGSPSTRAPLAPHAPGRRDTSAQPCRTEGIAGVPTSAAGCHRAPARTRRFLVDPTVTPGTRPYDGFTTSCPSE